MRAVIITHPGGPEVLEIQERPKPEPQLGQIRVRVCASALNRADLLQRQGNYPVPPGAPADIAGMEYAGEIDAVGRGDSAWSCRLMQRVVTGRRRSTRSWEVSASTRCWTWSAETISRETCV